MSAEESQDCSILKLNQIKHEVVIPRFPVAHPFRYAVETDDGEQEKRFRLVLRRSKPMLVDKFELSTRRDIDKRLLVGAALFCTGWGVAGFCPGPALTAIVIGGEPVVYFVLSILVGMFLADQFFAPKKANH